MKKLEICSNRLKKETGCRFNIWDLKYIFKTHTYLSCSDLKQIYVRTLEFGTGKFKEMIEAMIVYPDQNFRSLRYDQFKCKMWLIHCLSCFIEYHSEMIIVGSWHGLLALMLNYQGYQNVYCSDIDIEANEVAQYLGVTKWSNENDMFKIDFDDYDIIINTSCEHVAFENWLELIPEGKTVALQSTNLPDGDHTNPVDSLEDFKKSCEHIVSVERAEERTTAEKYKRFTIIGTT